MCLSEIADARNRMPVSRPSDLLCWASFSSVNKLILIAAAVWINAASLSDQSQCLHLWQLFCGSPGLANGCGDLVPNMSEFQRAVVKFSQPRKKCLKSQFPEIFWHCVKYVRLAWDMHLRNAWAGNFCKALFGHIRWNKEDNEWQKQSNGLSATAHQVPSSTVFQTCW